MDCPQRSEVSYLFKGTPTVLKEPFSSQWTQMVDQPNLLPLDLKCSR